LSWARWDTANGRTVYAATTAFGAFAEVLPYIAAGMAELPLDNLFDDIGEGDAGRSLRDAIAAEVGDPNMLNAVTRGWRDGRCRYEIQVPGDEWFVDIGAADSIAALNHVFQDEGPLTLSHLTGEDRYLTTRIAGWVRSRTLDDGSRARGIYYTSKYGSNLPCYAIWLRSTDDGNRRGEPVEQVASHGIWGNDVDLLRAAEIHDMRIW
jgi:hypothetical protein